MSISANSSHEEVLAWARVELGPSYDNFSTQLAQGGGGRADGELFFSIRSKKELQDKFGFEATVACKVWSCINPADLTTTVPAEDVEENDISNNERMVDAMVPG